MAWSSLACPPVAASRCFPTFPFRQSRDGRPQRVVRRKHSVIAMPVLPRLWDEIRKLGEKLKRREFDDAIGSRPRLPAVRPLKTFFQRSSKKMPALPLTSTSKQFAPCGMTLP